MFNFYFSLFSFIMKTYRPQYSPLILAILLSVVLTIIFNVTYLQKHRISELKGHKFNHLFAAVFSLPLLAKRQSRIICTIIMTFKKFSFILLHIKYLKSSLMSLWVCILLYSVYTLNNFIYKQFWRVSCNHRDLSVLIIENTG